MSPGPNLLPPLKINCPAGAVGSETVNIPANTLIQSFVLNANQNIPRVPCVVQFREDTTRGFASFEGNMSGGSTANFEESFSKVVNIVTPNRKCQVRVLIPNFTGIDFVANLNILIGDAL